MKKLQGLLFCILVFLAPASPHAGTDLAPASPDCVQVIRHAAFVLCYDEEHEQARWAMYTLTREMLGYSAPRSDDFRRDPLVQTGSAEPGDYRGSGFDKGHLVPAGDMKISRQCMSETFYMSNMSPQAPAFNRGIWKRLEDKVRDWARENGEVIVVTGPVLADRGFRTIGKNQVAVPFRYYKVILDYREPELKAIAFLMPNSGSKAGLETFAVTVDEAEEVCRIDFFPGLPDVIEDRLESRIDRDRWFHGKNLSLNH